MAPPDDAREEEKMKILVFGGSGTIGRTVAWDLARDEAVEAVGIVGRRQETLQETQAWIGSDKVKAHPTDIHDRDAVLPLMEVYDAGVVALPDRRSSYRLAEHAIAAGLDIVDMLEEYHRRPDAHEVEGLAVPEGLSLDDYGEQLHEAAVGNGVTFLDGMGFAPGLSNITLGQGIRQLDTAEAAVARVGGNPSREAAQRHPLRYMITWTFEHVLREYVVRLKVVRNGEVVEVDAGSEREAFRFNEFGQDEELECAITPGMPSFIYTRPQLREFAEKTVRWPGHWEAVETLKDCGLLDLEPLAYDGYRIVPRDFFSTLVTPKLQPHAGETDVSVMYNTLVGTKDGKTVRVEYFMWDEADPASGLSSMMRTTGFPVAIGARLLAGGRIDQKGVVAPEDAIRDEVYDDFMAELERRNIHIRERTTIL
jgi:lysine 6-dehydrogenase